MRPAPAGERRLLGEQHGERRRLLPAGAGRRPDPQSWRVPARARSERRQDLPPDDVELLRRAEEVGLLDGDQRDQAPPLAVDLAGRQRPHVLVEAGEARAPAPAAAPPPPGSRARAGGMTLPVVSRIRTTSCCSGGRRRPAGSWPDAVAAGGLGLVEAAVGERDQQVAARRRLRARRGRRRRRRR